MEAYFIVELVCAGERVIHRFDQSRVIFGRDPRRVHLHLPDQLASRRHGEITFAEGQVIVCDSRSTNGTFYDGVPYEGPFELKPGDSFCVGAVRVRLLEIVWPKGAHVRPPAVIEEIGFADTDPAATPVTIAPDGKVQWTRLESIRSNPDEAPTKERKRSA